MNSLYDYPELYNALRKPKQATLEAVYQLLCQRLGRPPRSVMDPACGPATWLEYFSRQGILVAGNDLSPSMVDAARQLCGSQALEFVTGDMCDPPFTRGPFEVTLELAGTCGMLASRERFQAFLASAVKWTQPGGWLVLTVFFPEPLETLPHLCAEWQVELENGGKAEISYQVIKTEPLRSIEWLQRTVRVEGSKRFPERLVDRYEMLVLTVPEFYRILNEIPELSIEGSFSLEEDGICYRKDLKALGEVAVLFRRR